MNLLDDLVARLRVMPAAQQAAILADAESILDRAVWVPNPGPQSLARDSLADELFYGGQAGGGKTDLLCGVALTDHTDSLILRRVNDDVKDLAKRAREIAGAAHRYNGQDKILTLARRSVRFGGCQYEQDKERWKGRPRDFFGFDEIGDFTHGQYKFITAWNRSAKLGQRCRVICAGNPPTKPQGLWVLKYWGAWLDPKHPNPAKPGELRWYTTHPETGDDIEVDGRGPHEIVGQFVFARSRTFIPAALADNPDLAATDYQASLDALPIELRSAYRDGNFAAELKDDEFQLIPTAWIKAAMERWTPDGHRGLQMSCIASDAAGGGADAAVIGTRYGNWFSELEEERGPQTKDGSFMAGKIVSRRRDACPVVIDAGGGYGGSYMLRLSDNHIIALAFVGSEKSFATTNDKSRLGFVNRRAEIGWRMREALDPDQEGGCDVALPPDDELKADLASIHWTLERLGIQLERKALIKETIGRSPGKGDTVMMLNAEGPRAARRAIGAAGIVHQSTSGYRPHERKYGR